MLVGPAVGAEKLREPIDLREREPELEMLPSEYFHRNWRITFMLDHYAVQNRRACGVRNLMWSTDYPHHGTDWPYSRKVVREMCQGLEEEEQQRILAQNAVELYKIGT